MNKPRVSKNQARRIADQQSARPGEVGLVISFYGAKALIENTDGQKITCQLRQHLGIITAGDRVVYSPDGVIESVLPRNSLLGRPDAKGNIKPVAVNINQVIITVAPVPALITDLLDSYLVACEYFNLDPIICLNKADLADQKLRDELTYYQKIYPFLETCVLDNRGITELASALKNHTNVFVGQSGVGKSSLIKSLLPDINIQIAASHHAHGRHTTSTAQLYHLPMGGNLIDSPGIRAFGLWQMNYHDIAQGFIEFRPYLGQCKFNDCQHDHEPDCAIITAANEQKISWDRLHNYRKLVNQQKP